MPVPATDTEVTDLYMNIRRREPRFPGFAYGFLYATGSRQRRTVAVPYNYGVLKLVSTNDLHVHAWVPNTSMGHHMVDKSVGRILVSTLPGSNVPLEFQYSIIYVPPNALPPFPSNACRSIRGSTQWHGNVLVLKHGKRKAVINMEKEDAFLVDSILSSLSVAGRSPTMAGANQKKRKHQKQIAYDKRGRHLRIKRARETASAIAFFFLPEMFLMELLHRCDLFAIMALAKTCCYARGLIKAFFACNLQLLVARFVPEPHISPFFTLLYSSLSAMAGSTVSSVLTFPYRHSWTPQDLNVYVPLGAAQPWQTFLLAAGFAVVPQRSVIDQRFNHSTVSHVVYLSAITGLNIAVTESRDRSVLTPLLSATTTFATNLATSSDFYCLYPYLLRHKRALEGWFPTPVPKAVTLGRRGIRSSFSTASWVRPCGQCCPVRWRDVRGLNGVGVFRWGGPGGEYADGTSEGVPFSDNDIQWRLGDSRCESAAHPAFPVSFMALDPVHLGGTRAFRSLFDTSQHRLSPEKESLIASLNGTAYADSDQWQDVFRGLDPLRLFILGTRDETMFTVVMAHVRAHSGPTGHRDELALGGPQDCFSKLPVEVFPSILAYLPLRDRIHFGLCSKRCLALHRREFQASVNRVLLPFGVAHAEVRFMQAATGAVLGGPPVACVFDYQAEPLRLEFYASYNMYPWVLRFLELATVYSAQRKIFNLPPGVASGASCTAEGRPNHVLVFAAQRQNPLDALTHYAFSHQMGAITHYGLWHPYGRSTLRQVSLPNRPCIPMTFWRVKDTVKIAAADARSSGFRLSFSKEGPHQCGTSFGCPMTPRTSIDPGCMNIFFPSGALGAQCAESHSHVYPFPSAVSWSLEGRACPDGHQATSCAPDVEVLPRMDMGYSGWKMTMTDIIHPASEQE
ncbi:hypothetical protein C8R46DRAFT_1213575 [Mycena filopes]|nr:hypothetical protein C8R46DRAFT_1213575 [Mycena filopes]